MHAHKETHRERHTHTYKHNKHKKKTKQKIVFLVCNIILKYVEIKQLRGKKSRDFSS